MREAMNRIERLLWEEANLRDMERRRSRGATFARALSIGLAVGMFVLLAARPWPASFYDAREQASNAKWAAIQSAAPSKPAHGARAGGDGDRIVEPERYTPRDDGPAGGF
jgi:hypothetical protein